MLKVTCGIACCWVLCSLQMFAWEAAQDKTLIILMVCAVISLVAGVITDVSTRKGDLLTV